MGLPYPKDLPDAWGMIKALEGQVKFLKSELEEWKLAAGESPDSKWRDLFNSIRYSPKIMQTPHTSGGCRLLVALCALPKGCRDKATILQCIRNLQNRTWTPFEDADLKIVEVYLVYTRKILKAANAPGEIITHWGRGFSMTDDLRAWVLSFADGGA